MSAALIAGIGLVGGAGAITRFLLDRAVTDRIGRDFPYGTLAVNLIGAFILGVFAGAALTGDAYRLLGTGLIGAFTTFSTWALESHRLGEEGKLGLGLANFGVSLVLGVAAAWAGRRVGGWL